MVLFLNFDLQLRENESMMDRVNRTCNKFRVVSYKLTETVMDFHHCIFAYENRLELLFCIFT